VLTLGVRLGDAVGILSMAGGRALAFTIFFYVVIFTPVLLKR